MRYVHLFTGHKTDYPRWQRLYQRLKFRIRVFKHRHKRFMQRKTGYTPRRHHYVATFVVGVMLLGLGVISQTQNIRAEQIILDKDAVLHENVNFSEINASYEGDISLQKGNIGTWAGDDGLVQPPVMSHGETAMTYGPNDTVYFMTYVANCRFLKYDVEKKEWTYQKTPPVGCAAGSSLMYDTVNSLYFVPGGDSQQIFRFDILTDEWVKLPNIPMPVGNGASATFVKSGSNRYIYTFRGKGSTSFWRFNITANAWESLTPFPASQSVDWGIDLAWDGAGSLYAISNHSGGEFKRYSILGNNWVDLNSTDTGHRRSKLFFADGYVYNMQLRWCCSGNNDNYYMQRYSPATDTWEDRTGPPMRQVHDFSPPGVFDGNDTFYTFAGGREYRPSFMKYSVDADSWNNDFGLFKENGLLAHWEPWFDGGNTIYYIGGSSYSSLNQVYKMDITTGEAEQIGAQFGANNGIFGTYYNNALYTVDYFGGSQFRKFDLSTNDFVELPDMPYASNWGSDLTDGGDGFLYATFGGRSNFWRFSEGAGWQARASMPVTISTGGAVARIGDAIYVQVGNSSSYFLKYSITNNTWSYAPEMPNGSLSHGSTLESDGSRYIYSVPGTRSMEDNRRLFRFDTVTNNWERMADLPSFTNVGATSFYDTTNNRLFIASGTYEPHLWHWTPSSTAYVEQGNWYSKTLDLKQVAAWNGLTTTVTGTGQATFHTRTSSNGKIWNAWQPVSGSTVQSSPARYVQIKAILTGNGSATPTISDINLNYSQEAQAPTLPSQLTAQGNKDGPALTSGQTSEYQHPYFKWQGASDGTNGAGIKGYHVYYGTNSSADPAVDGSFQENTDYTVSTAMTAGSIYYLRIKVEDNLGNISNAATFFSYRYFYISPPGSMMTTTRNEFASGTNTAVDLNLDGNMRLLKQDSGSWAEGIVKMLPDTTNGPAGAVVGDHLYVARGNNSDTLWRYNLVSQVWETLASAPSAITIGSSMTWGGGDYLYVIKGDTTNEFFRYDIQNNTWQTMKNLPANARQGTDIKYVGNNKFVILFSGVAEFYIYDATTDQFINKTSPPVSVEGNFAGSGIWYDGTDTVYAYFGGTYLYNGYRYSMAKYTLSEDSWRRLEVPPINSYYMENNLVGDSRGNLYMFAQDDMYNSSGDDMAMRYDIATDTWEPIEEYYGVGARGTVISDNQRYMYIIPSNGNSRRIITYDSWDKEFTPLGFEPTSWARAPWSHDSSWDWYSENSTTAAYDGTEYIYAIGGDERNGHKFLKYSLKDQSTIYLPPPPFVGIGGDLEWFQDEIYYLPAANTNYFWKFNHGTEDWVRLTNYPSSVYRPGEDSLIGVNNQYLYGFRGNSNQLHRYEPNDSGGTWTAMASAPASLRQATFAYDGGNFIYVTRGLNTPSFYRYDIAANSWTTLEDLPENSNYGGAMVYNQGKLYMGVGAWSSNSYIYDVTGGTWSAGASIPEPPRWGSTWIRVDDTTSIYFPGDSGADFWQFNFPSESRSHQSLATHISPPKQIDGLFDYAGITAEVDLPENTKVEFFTRTSATSVQWEDWKRADQVKYYNGRMSVRVTSTPQKYTQIKVVLSSLDNVHTPTVGSYALDYYFDIDPPDNPTVLTTYATPAKQTVLNNNTWYNHAAATFDWPDPGQAGGATDGDLGSRIRGYWVYVGTDPTATPRTAGVFVESTEYTPNLTQSGTYYFRLQSQDMTGNVDADIFAPFIYKFDNTPPNNSPFVTVTPSGFTSNNNFTFTWPNAFDAHSGISKYCYRTGATTGAFAVETCQDGKELVDVPAAYTQGTNVFYLRALDRAGNYATSDIEASFYYSTQPPSPVTNLEPIPPSSTQNLFTFTWDLPTYFAGDPGQLTYCFSINVLPSAENTTCVEQRYLPAFKAATQKGTNTIYVVARDESGGVNWNNYASTNFIANTVSPGIPLNLVVTDTSDRAANRWALTATWDPPTFEGNGLDYYVVERSTDGHTFEEIGTVSNTAWVDMNVEPDTMYHYRVRASDDVDNFGGASAVVAQNAKGRFIDPPNIVSEPSAQPSFDRADIRWVTERASTSFVYYGDSPTTLEQSKGSLNPVSEHGVTITGLEPSKVYYYKVQSFDNERNYNLEDSFSNIYTFRTTESARIYNVAASDVGLSSALLNWQTSVPTKVRIEYGPTTAYGLYKDFDTTGYATNHIVKLDGLSSGTTYHYRISATTQYGSVITSDSYSLTTIPYPRVSNVDFQPVQQPTGQGVKVTWTTNVPTTSVLSYETQGSKQEEAKDELVTQHEVLVSGLAGSAEYSFEVRGRDQYGNLATGDSQKWTSGVDTKAPEISNISIDVSTSENWGNAKAQFIVSWQTDEPSTSQVIYGDSNSEADLTKTPLDTEPKTSHVMVISNLDLAKVYQIQPVSTDINGNEAYGSQLTAVSPDKESSALDLILRLLQRIF